MIPRHDSLNSLTAFYDSYEEHTSLRSLNWLISPQFISILASALFKGTGDLHRGRLLTSCWPRIKQHAHGTEAWLKVRPSEQTRLKWIIERAAFTSSQINDFLTTTKMDLWWNQFRIVCSVTQSSMMTNGLLFVSDAYSNTVAILEYVISIFLYNRTHWSRKITLS